MSGKSTSATQAERPRFCPRCRQGVSARGPLCPECGEALRTQGYCGVCEAFWPLPAGSDCPKHEIALDEQGPEPWPDAASARDGWTTIGRFASAGQAEALRIRLEAEGIPTFLQGERMGSASMYAVATGGVAIQVPKPLAADARVIVSQTWSPPPELADDLDDAWDELGPDPGAYRLTLMKGFVVASFIASAILILGQLALGWLSGMK